MRSLLLLCSCAVAAFAQPFSAGVKVGVPLTDALSTAESGNLSYFTTTHRYVVGVTGELRLPFGLGVELDILYRRLNYNFSSGSVGVTPATQGEAASNAWEFPLLAKYRFPTRIARPFFTGGVAWDTLQGLTQSVTTLSGNPIKTTTSSPSTLQHNTTKGFVLGFGIDVHALVIHISPEVRYTRWGAKHFLDPNGFLSSNQNQAEFLVGIGF